MLSLKTVGELEGLGLGAKLFVGVGSGRLKSWSSLEGAWDAGRSMGRRSLGGNRRIFFYVLFLIVVSAIGTVADGHRFEWQSSNVKRNQLLDNVVVFET